LVSGHEDYVRIKVLDESERAVDQLSDRAVGRDSQVLLSGAVCLLDSTAFLGQHRRKEKGSLADVYASYFHESLAHLVVWVLPDKGRECGLGDHGSLRYSPSSKYSIPNFFSANIIHQAAKMLNYLAYSLACDIAFGIFLVAWFFSRHVAYMLVVHSIIKHVPEEMKVGCYESTTGKLVSSDGGNAVFANVLQPFNDPNGLVCYNSRIQYIFLSLLLGLQVLTLIWFAMVLRVAYAVLTGKNAADSRSDDEAESEEETIEESEDESIDEKTRISDVESSSGEAPAVGEASSSKGKGRAVKGRSESPASVSAASSRPRRSGRTTGISLPGHGDRKDLLGRIGCDKPT
jgi:hypothetical protein